MKKNNIMIFAEEIEKIFPFFPRLHAIFASRPNVTPICITTALGPNGRSTVWYQPPDHLIDPQLLAISSLARVPMEMSHTNSQIAPTGTPSRIFGSDMANEAVPASQDSQLPPTPTPGIENIPIRTQTPKPSTFSNDILAKARASIQAVPKKRTLGETLMDIQRLAYLIQ